MPNVVHLLLIRQWVIEGNLGVRSGVMVLPDDVEAVLLINTNGPFFPHRILESGFEDCYPRISHSVDRDAGQAWVYVAIPKTADEGMRFDLCPR